MQNFAARRKKGMVIQMDYTTQMDAARKGILTGQLRAVAVEEKMEAERLRELVAKGQAVIPANKTTSASKPAALGAPTHEDQCEPRRVQRLP